MLTRCVFTLLVFAALEACAHKGAVRVLCDGVLRPINAPDAPPVTVESATSDTEGKRP
jgi:hypothetical protein